jgi:putative DNA-binding protein
MIFANTDLEDAFAAALLAPEAALPRGVVGPRGKRADKRFAVYRNNVTVSLTNALGDIFPAIRALVGENNFGHIARAFVRAHPPASPLLFEYGDHFPDYLATLEPLRRYPYLPDVAQLERAWLDAFHAADAEPLATDALAKIDPEALGDVVFTPHPATRLIESGYAIVTIMSRSRAGEPLSGINPADGETALVTRAFATVEVRSVPPGGDVFFRALIAGASLGVAASDAGANEDFELPAAIAALIESGAFVALSLPNRDAGDSQP